MGGTLEGNGGNGRGLLDVGTREISAQSAHYDGEPESTLNSYGYGYVGGETERASCLPVLLMGV